MFAKFARVVRPVSYLQNSLIKNGILTSFSTIGVRSFASESSYDDKLATLRNIGISAHIDSGKTTLTERILYYTHRIKQIHEVRGKDGVGAKMDSMDLEREKGITIQSAATHCTWKDNNINIIDTPGHVDFTIEVERALRVLDGAILVLCGVGGVQSQSITVDRQMKRYGVPRICFINKLDRQGANPDRVVQQLKEKLGLNAAAVQIPIGLESELKGVVDIINEKALYFEGENGDIIRETPVPEELKEKVQAKRKILFEALADVNESMEELYLLEQQPTPEQFQKAIRKSTIDCTFVPVFMGSAFKNKGVLIQALLDGVCAYLPSPNDKVNKAVDLDHNEEEVTLSGKSDDDLVALAFKLEESRFGQLTYLRVYQGSLKRADSITNMRTKKSIKVPRIVRMHSNEMEEVDGVGSGEIVAMFGVDCNSGDTFTNNKVHYSMTSMYVPEPVISLAVSPKNKNNDANFAKALSRFQREDPTFRMEIDKESKETVIKGMGELHLQIYIERIKREYKCELNVSPPRVNYRETITKRADFNYLHKKQSGGAGQFGRVIGYIEPIEEGGAKYEFVNKLIGNNIPPEFVPAIEKGFKEALEEGKLLGYPITNMRFVLTDGQSHSVDSNELAFKSAAKYAVYSAFEQAQPVLLEPLMSVEVTAPQDFQGVVLAGLNRRKGLIQNSSVDERGTLTVDADVPLASMFGYSTDLRSQTQGQGEFTMEYKTMSRVPKNVVEELQKKKLSEKKN